MQTCFAQNIVIQAVGITSNPTLSSNTQSLVDSPSKTSTLQVSPFATKEITPLLAITPPVTSDTNSQTKPNHPEKLLNVETPAKAIVEDLWDRMRNGFAMPNLETRLAEDKTAWYAKQPDYISRMTARGSQYLYYIVEELEKRGMPSELALLPFVESAFNPQAVSSAKAAGMWQFMPATGKHFNLKQNVWQDERRGVVESTRAALDYLQKLHGMFGDWHLALAAYNWGEGSVQRAINKNKAKGLPTAYTDLKMPLETQQYVPKFQAVKNIIDKPESYGITLNPVANAPFFALVSKENDIDVALAAKFSGLSLPEFKSLNPGFKTPVILGATKPEILMPASNVEGFKAALNNYTGNLSSWTSTRISATQKPALIAKKYGISEAELREVNNIPPRMLIKDGSVLVVPKRDADGEVKNISENVAESGQLNLIPEAIRRIHTVRRGDSIASIAKRYGITSADIRSWNGNISNNVSSGQKLTLYVAVKQTKTRAVSNKKAMPKKIQKKKRSKY